MQSRIKGRCNQFMPKKHSRKVQYHKDNKKRRMRRLMQERLKRLSQSELTFRTCPLSQSSHEESSKLDSTSHASCRKLLKRIPPDNFIQTLQYPVQTNCIFTLYGMITIDENALKNQVKDQSLIKALFNFYSLNEVQINPDYLLLKIHKSKQNYFPIQYVVQRFKSYGDSYFYEMAKKIQEIRAVFDKMMSMPSPPHFSEKQIQKFIEDTRGKRAMLRISPNLLVFTNELLEVGGYSISDIGSECISYRSFVSDVFLADNYRGQINKFFELYQLGKRLRKGEVTPNEYMNLARQREVEYIVSKQNTVMKVVTSKYNLVPGVGCWEIEEVSGEEKFVPCLNKEIMARKQQFVEQSVGKNIIPEHFKKLNRSLICSYRNKEQVAN